MITETYVSYETARLLKQHNFHGHCFRYYQDFQLKESPLKSPMDFNSPEKEYVYSAPSQQTALSWLRGKHIIIVVEPEGFNDDGTCSGWMFSVWYEDHYSGEISGNYKTYEEAAEAAIIAVLTSIQARL